MLVAKARGEYLRTHFKNMREVAAVLTGMLDFSGMSRELLKIDGNQA